MRGVSERARSRSERGERPRVRSGPGVVALFVGIALAVLGLGYIGYTVMSGMRGNTPVTAPR